YRSLFHRCFNRSDDDHAWFSETSCSILYGCDRRWKGDLFVLMDRETQITAIDRYIQSLFTHYSTGHDVYHMRRVANLAKSIAIDEQANIFLVEAGALLHDIGDKKLFPDPS